MRPKQGPFEHQLTCHLHERAVFSIHHALIHSVQFCPLLEPRLYGLNATIFLIDHFRHKNLPNFIFHGQHDTQFTVRANLIRNNMKLQGPFYCIIELKDTKSNGKKVMLKEGNNFLFTILRVNRYFLRLKNHSTTTLLSSKGEEVKKGARKVKVTFSKPADLGCCKSHSSITGCSV